MNRDKQHIYTAADIENYFSGKLLPAEQYAMEKAALEDPFLAEAMEGYESMQGNNWTATLAALKQDLSQRQQGARLVTMHPRRNKSWKAIAAVLLIGGSAAVAYLLFNNRSTDTTPPQHLADNKRKVNTTPDTIRVHTVLPSTPAGNENDPVASTVPAVTPAVPLAKQVTNADNKAIAGIKVESNDKKTINTLATPEAPKTSNASNNLDVVTNNTGTLSPAAAPAPEALTRKKDFEINPVPSRSFVNRNFNAVVLAPDNTPLPFANIAIRSENFGTYADVKGNVRLLYPDSVLTVEVRSAGYKPRNFVLRSNVAQNKLVLTQEPIPLNETTVVSGRANGYGATRRVSLLKDTAVSVEPADGWENYNRYIANNIDIPDEMLKKNLHGEMEISFDVQSNGAISNVKVDKSLCNDCDEAAKRILEQGPQWKVKKGKSSSGKIKLRF